MNFEKTFKILNFLRPPIERWIVRALIGAGILLITNGLQGFSLFVELFLHILEIESEKRLGMNYSIDTINWTSVIFGLLLILFGIFLHSFYKKAEAKLNKPKKLFIAVIHKSIDDYIKPIYSKLDNFILEEFQIQEIEIDQTIIYKNGNLEYPEASILYQNDILSKIKALTDNNREFEIAYFGLAHIPLVWLLGNKIADKFEINYYEYDRISAKWNRLERIQHESNNFYNLQEITLENESQNGIIKIEISYEIENTEVFQVVDNHKYFTTLKLNSVGLDRITNLNQIDKLTQSFRCEVDKLIKDSNIKYLHIFYSGPVSLGLSLSRKISKRTDPNFIVYNYTRNSSPKYKWAILMSNDNPEILKF